MGGNEGFDASADLKWMERWQIYKAKSASETQFNSSGDLVGYKTRKLQNTGISIWALIDGSPYAGGILSWNGKKYTWIHQGE